MTEGKIRNQQHQSIQLTGYANCRRGCPATSPLGCNSRNADRLGQLPGVGDCPVPAHARPFSLPQHCGVPRNHAEEIANILAEHQHKCAADQAARISFGLEC